LPAETLTASTMSGYQGLHFSISSLKSEIQCLSGLAKPFLEPETHRVLAGWESGLAAIEASNTSATSFWQISADMPLRTRKTRGFEPAPKKGGHDIWGELSFVWTVNRVSVSNRKLRDLICLNGLASTRVRIFRDFDGGPKVIGQWQVEVGDHQSPGWHFHVGLCRDGNEVPFPKWLCVPRIPGVLIAPTDALDFLLGELFQDAWRKTVSTDHYQNVTLGKAQSNRIQRLSAWQSEQAADGKGSAWNRLKHRRPASTLFQP